MFNLKYLIAHNKFSLDHITQAKAPTCLTVKPNGAGDLKSRGKLQLLLQC